MKWFVTDEFKIRENSAQHIFTIKIQKMVWSKEIAQ